MSGAAAPAARQLALPFVHRAGGAGRVAADGAFVDAPSNEAARAFLAPGAERGWPERRLLLWGAAGIGKTALLHRWVGGLVARGADAAVIEGPLADSLDPAQPLPAADALAIDDVDLVAGGAGERALLHAVNRAGEARMPLLLAARAPPPALGFALPDLSSRMRACLAVALGTPEDALLDALLGRLLAERQLALPEPVARRLLLLLPREADAIREAVAMLDRTLMEEGGRPTLALAAAVARRIEAGEQASSSRISPVEPGLL